MIIHKTNKKGYYICNHACGPKPTPEKCSYRWNKVTCKNCLGYRKSKPITFPNTTSYASTYTIKCIQNDLKSHKSWYKRIYRYIKRQLRLFFK